MNTRRIPLRKCVSTGEILPKKELIRIVRTPNGDVNIDYSSRANGRGAYLKKSSAAIEKAKKSNCLGKALECEIPESIYKELELIVKEN